MFRPRILALGAALTCLMACAVGTAPAQQKGGKQPANKTPAAKQQPGGKAKADAPKVLLHFGVETAEPKLLAENVTEMEKDCPFGGVIFRVPGKNTGFKNSYMHKNCFGSSKLEWEPFAGELKRMNDTKLTKLTANFLRFNVEPGDVDWFEDWTTILANAKLVAKWAKECKTCRGLIVDTEAYGGRVMTYEARPLKGTKTLKQYQDKVQERAAELMKAFESEYPGLEIILTHGFETGDRPEGKDTKVGKLLMSFVYGLRVGASKDAVFHDAYEKGFGMKTEAQFLKAKKDVEIAVAAGPKAEAKVKMAYMLSVDYPHKTPLNTEGTPNHFKPAELTQALRLGLANADEFVIHYNQASARWFSFLPERPATIPDDYRKAILDAVKPPAKK